MKMAQPATLMARMNPSIAASRPHSRAVAAVRSPLITETALPPRTGVRETGQVRRPDSSPRRGLTVAGQCRARTGLRWLAAAPVAPGSWARYKPGPDTVKAHQMIRCQSTEAAQIYGSRPDLRKPPGSTEAQIYGSRAATGPSASW